VYGGDAVTQKTMTRGLYAATGASESDDAFEAGRSAAEQAVSKLAGKTPGLVVVYVSVRYDLSTLLAGVRSITGDIPLVGASSSGHFHGAELIEPSRGVAVLVLTAGRYQFGVASVGDLAADGVAAGERLARAAREAAGPRSPYATVILFSDGLAVEQQELVVGIHKVAGAAVPVVGGAAADDRRLTETFVLHGDRALTNAAAAVWIGSDRPMPVTVGHGWHAISMPMLVTKVDGQIVHEIAGRPARDVFEEYFRSGYVEAVDPIRHSGYYSTHAFGLIEPDGSYLIRSVFLGPDGLVRTLGLLPVYSAIQIVECDEDSLLDMSQRVVARTMDGREPEISVLLVFSCVARLDVLAERGAEEASRLQEAAGEVPIFGIYTYGEFARTTSVAGYHNCTVAAIAL
jgi:hypothetical protein